MAKMMSGVSMSQPTRISPVNEVAFVEPVNETSYGPYIYCVEDHKRPPTQGVLLSDLVRESHIYVHEVFGLDDQWLKPYYDYESYYETEEEMLRNKSTEWAKCISLLRTVWPITIPINGCEACGYKREKGKYIISFHFVVSNAGAYRCGADMLRAGLLPDTLVKAGFDKQPYGEVGSRRCMRMIGMSKSGEDRPLRFVVNKPDGSPQGLDIWTLSPEHRLLVTKVMLVQFAEGEKHIEVEKPEPVRMSIGSGDVEVALGKNGQPLGDDIRITTVAQVRELCMIAGKFAEVNRDYDTYIKLMFSLRNAADTYLLPIDEMRNLALELAAVCANNDASHAAKCFDTSGDRVWRPRCSIARLRAEAKEKNEGSYLLWLQSVRNERPEPAEEKKSTGEEERKPYLFKDHNAFVGKEIELSTASAWAKDAIVQVQGGGDAYYLTRNRRVCEMTNQSIEFWQHVSRINLLNCLDVAVYVKNPNYDAKNPSAKEEDKLLFTNFGNSTKSSPGFLAHQIAHRQVPWVNREDFIPFLKRRIPDADIARAVTDKEMFNKFRGFPIEEHAYDPEGPQFFGSAWHSHLINTFCHGDMNEWKHLEATIADMIQRPYRISNVAHVFQSGQGTGKRHLHQFMSELLGTAHTMMIGDMGVYTQRFNDDHSTAILKVFEEVRGKGDQFMNNDRLKDDITKLVLRVEIKGGAILTLRHCARYWFFTNHRDNLHIEADDRRYVYHSVSNEHANDWDYFTPIVAELKDRKYLRACFEYFANLSYDEQLVMTAISTDYKNEQKLDSMPLHLKFMRDLIEDKMLATADPTRVDGDKIAASLIYDLYNSWCSTNHHQAGSSKSLMKSLALVNLKQRNMRIHGEQKKCLEVNREALRDSFRAHFKMPTFDWQE